MKVLISVDMEGIAGVTKREGVWRDSPLYPKYQEFMTDETNVAIDACYDAGALEVLVIDGHGDSNNLLLPKLSSKARVLRKSPQYAMMTGIEEADKVIFLGYHGMAGVDNSFCAHTNSSEWIKNVHFNSVPMGEGLMNFLLAQHLNVPVVLLSGTDYAVSELKSYAPWLTTVTSLTSISYEQAHSINELQHYTVLYERIMTSLKTSSIQKIPWQFNDVQVEICLKKEPHNKIVLNQLDADKRILFTSPSFSQAYQSYRSLLASLFMSRSVA